MARRVLPEDGDACINIGWEYTMVRLQTNNCKTKNFKHNFIKKLGEKN